MTTNTIAQPNPTQHISYVGIDPGANAAAPGAIAGVSATGHLILVRDILVLDGFVNVPDLVRTADDVMERADHACRLFEGDPHDCLIVGIEHVRAMPKQGVASTFKFGDAFGCARTIFAPHGCRIFQIRPSGWKATHGLAGLDKKRAKEKARALATEKWPHFSDEFRLVKNAGRAEAALIADHLRQRDT